MCPWFSGGSSVLMLKSRAWLEHGPGVLGGDSTCPSPAQMSLRAVHWPRPPRPCVDGDGPAPGTCKGLEARAFGAGSGPREGLSTDSEA